MGRKRYHSDGEDTEDDDFVPGTKETTWGSSKQKRAKVNAPKIPMPSTKATIMILATDVSPDQANTRERLDKIDSGVLTRIRKSLALAQHDGTGEDEAKAALRMATKLMSLHSITQADVLSQETEDEKLERAGISVVAVRRTSGDGPVKLENWASDAGYAMTVFFDCQNYTESYGDRMSFSFYGLAEQTVAAAYAFEMSYNLILAWSMEDKIARGLKNKNAYRRGVAKGLIKVAKEEKKSESKMAEVRERQLLEAKKKEEAKDEQRRLVRLHGPKPSQEAQPKGEEQPTMVKQETEDGRVELEEVEDEDTVLRQPIQDNAANLEGRAVFEFTKEELDNDYVPEDIGLGEEETYLRADFGQDSDDDGNDNGYHGQRTKSEEAMPPPAISSVKEEPEKEEEDVQWSSINQLVAFRETSVAVGNDYLKSQGITLKKGRSRPAYELKDQEAVRMWQMGQRDAKKIDVRGRKKLMANEFD